MIILTFPMPLGMSDFLLCCLPGRSQQCVGIANWLYMGFLTFWKVAQWLRGLAAFIFPISVHQITQPKMVISIHVMHYQTAAVCSAGVGLYGNNWSCGAAKKKLASMTASMVLVCEGSYFVTIKYYEVHSKSSETAATTRKTNYQI